MDKESEKIQVHLPYPMLNARFTEVLGLGVNPEVYIDGADLSSPCKEFLLKVRDEFTARGLRITQHGPYLGLNPADLDEQKRRFTVKKYREAFSAAEALGSSAIVLHAGYAKKRYRGDVNRWLEAAMKTWPEFVKRAGDSGIIIAAENILEREPAPLLRLVEEINSPNFRLCIDSGHLNIFSKASFELWFKTLGPYIAELHLHDNRGLADEHLPLGEGSIDFTKYFRLLRKYKVRPIYTIEPHNEEAFPKAIKAARSFISPSAD